MAQRGPSKISTAEEAMQSFKIKKNILLQALQFKKNGNMKEYYSLINKQSFVNAKEEPQALRIWVKVFLEALSIIIHEYQDHELLELLVFKLPWFIPTTTHGQNFNSFMRLVLAVLPHDVSYLHKVIKHIFSPHGLFQCIMLGEHRPVFADLLWDRAQVIIQSLEKISAENTQDAHSNDKITEDQITSLNKYFKEIKTSEDILVRAKSLLKQYTDQNQGSITRVQNLNEEIFLKTIFSFHPTRDLPENLNYPILVGKCQGFSTFFVKALILTDQALPDEDDAISVRKCVNNIVQVYTQKLKEFGEVKFKVTPLKQLGFFLSKLMNLYPFAHSNIITNLIEKLPHKNMAVENQYLYYRMLLEIAKVCPENEEKILEAVVEKLCQLDVDIKGKIRKFQFSNISKIQPLSSFLKELLVKVPTEKETKMGILFDMLLEYILERTKEQVVNKNQSSFEEFIETLMKIFEQKIFPIHKLNFMQYLPLYCITLSSQNEKCRIFAEKLLSFLIFKAFNCVQKEHVSIRQQSWNYLSSLISRQNSIIKEQTLMKCMSFILKYYDSNCRVKSKNSNFSSTEVSDTENVALPLASQDKIFQHCFIQGLVLILITKNDIIQKNDPELFTTLCKFVFKKYFKSLSYCSPLILADLLKLTESNKHGLGFFKHKVQEVFKHQNEELKTSKRQVYNKVSKYMAYESPMYLYPCSTRLASSLIYEDISSEPIYNEELQAQETNEVTQQVTNTKEIKQEYAIKHEEIDFPSSSQEEEKKLTSPKVDENQSVIFVPDLNQLPQQSSCNEDMDMKIIQLSSEKQFPQIDLKEAIQQSRHAGSLFNFPNNNGEIEFKKVQFQSQISLNSISKLSVNTLNELNNGMSSQIDDYEVISSSKDTEYSISPYAQGKGKVNTMIDNQNEKASKKRNVERQRRNLTNNLKEENDRARVITRQSAKKLNIELKSMSQQ